MSEKIKQVSANKDPSTEEKILIAAREVFMQKGFDGARMQEIADVAGINKALLHYYFRSKDKLFKAVFEYAIQKLFPSMMQIFSSQGSLSEKIRRFFDIHAGFLIENPLVPRFIVHEMSAHPERLQVFFAYFKNLDPYQKFDKLIRESISLGEIREIEPIQLLLNLVSLSVFPVLAGPMLSGALDLNEEEYRAILEKRKVHAADFVIRAIT